MRKESWEIFSFVSLGILTRDFGESPAPFLFLWIYRERVLGYIFVCFIEYISEGSWEINSLLEKDLGEPPAFLLTR